MDLMIDFETLDTKAGAVLLSAGIILFDPEKPEDREEHYFEFHVEKQIPAGRTISSSTLEWWLRQDPGELVRLMREGEDLLYNLQLLVERMPEVRKVWSRGHMDFEILCDICPGHFKYYQHADVRTLDALGFSMKRENNHNALDDCRNQLDYVTEVMSICCNTAQPVEDPS